ncbi:hypothetical protein [Sphingorhabdus sp.]|jgi:hypothetical protein|uniref:hypothetical protein n=1 Tax=Sphingorhabdus sp. TaxID=1902408 RepID=UPI003BB11C5B|nr:hypothetical protein [Sphingomonadales bacterium]MBK9431416.1 hypothetical protein [Sphingomonadales bacterium]
MKRVAAALIMALFATGAAASSPEPPAAPTQVQDRPALERLLGASGMTLQWLSWTSSERGQVDLSWQDRALFLKGEQRGTDGTGRVSVNGHVVRISADEFILNGTIIIEDTPDAGRRCEKSGEWRFAVTQNRKYWRLRQFEWCDYLTDYIDIYF